MRQHRDSRLTCSATIKSPGVVRCGVYVADLSDLPRVNVAYARAFGDRLPTRTTVGVQLPGYGVEIDCVAVIPSSESGRPS